MDSFLKKLSILNRQSNSNLDHRLRQIGVTGGQFMYIIKICDNPGLSQENIVNELHIDRGAVARAVKQLESDGYIIRTNAPGDKRQYSIYPTARAQETCQRIRNIVADCENFLSQDLTEVERELFNILLNKIMRRAMQL